VACVNIVPFREEHASAFRSLQYEWLTANDLLEPCDVVELAALEDTYLGPGSALRVAVDKRVVVGGYAVTAVDHETFELSRLAVAAARRRQGIGRQLIESAMDFAVSRGGTRLVLASNSRLTAALRLYERLGFHYQPVPPAVAEKYRTADIYMSASLRVRTQRSPMLDQFRPAGPPTLSNL